MNFYTIHDKAGELIASTECRLSAVLYARSISDKVEEPVIIDSKGDSIDWKVFKFKSEINSNFDKVIQSDYFL